MKNLKMFVFSILCIAVCALPAHATQSVRCWTTGGAEKRIQLVLNFGTADCEVTEGSVTQAEFPNEMNSFHRDSNRSRFEDTAFLYLDSDGSDVVSVVRSDDSGKTQFNFTATWGPMGIGLGQIHVLSPDLELNRPIYCVYE